MSGNPSGHEWPLQPLESVAAVNPPSKETVVGDDVEVTFIPMAAVQEESGLVDYSETRLFKEVKKGYTRFRDGDVIFAKITPCMENGKAAVVKGLTNGVGCGSTEFHVVRPSERLRPKFAWYYLIQSRFRHHAQRLMQGAVGQKRVPPKVLREAEIPIPSLATQDQVSQKIDELFSRIDEGERALKTVETLVERYRQSVLKAAVTGELTRDWREAHQHEFGKTIETGEQLLARILKARREAWEKAELEKMIAKGKPPKNDAWKSKYVEPDLENAVSSRSCPIPPSWAQVTIGDVAICLDSRRVPVNAKARAQRVGEIPYYGANGQVGTIDDFLFDEPLVVVVEDETFTGRTKPFSYIIRGKSWVNNHAHVLRPTTALSVEFLNTLLMHYPFIPLTTGTTGRRKLTQKALMSAPIFLPSPAEQSIILDRVSAALSELESTFRSTLDALREGRALRQSILSKAFAGGLA